MIYIASDHGGFELKKVIGAWLTKKRIAYKDLGPNTFSENDDYPKYAAKVGNAVSKNPKEDQGILLCRSGVGVTIVANKFKGVRAALCWNEHIAKSSRVDDDANVLCLPADYISLETAENITNIWLKSSFSTALRHHRRIAEIEDLEK